VSDTWSVSAAVAASLLAGSGAWLIYGAVIPASARPRRDQVSPGRAGAKPSDRMRDALGLGPVSVAELASAVAVVALGGAVAGFLLFGATVPAVVSGLFAGTFPLAAYRRRRVARLEEAAAEWPRLLEEIRLRAGSLGRSIPQALFEAGHNAPAEWRPALDAAEREWLLTVDFARTVSMLKERLADPTADTICETLLMAHEIGGTDLEPKLAELIEDRTQDIESRRDAESRLAGVRFARRFVVVVPIGMAVAGLTIGTGRHAYATVGGQLAVVVGLVAIAVCWWWAGRLMKVPAPPRVFR